MLLFWNEIQIILLILLSVKEAVCHPNTQQVEARGLEGPQGEVKASLGYTIKSHLKKKRVEEEASTFTRSILPNLE